MTVGDGDGAADRATQPVTLADIARRGRLTLDGLACDQRQGLRLGVHPRAVARCRRPARPRCERVCAHAQAEDEPRRRRRRLRPRQPVLRTSVGGDRADAARGRHQMVLVGDNGENAEELAAVRTFLAMRAPGVIMTPVGAACELLHRHGVSVVEVDERLAGGVDADRPVDAAPARARRAARRTSCGPDIGAWRCWSPTPTGRATSAGSPATGGGTTRPRCRWTSG